MKTLNEILDNYKDYAVVLDDRFGSRLAKFLTEEQLEKIGFKYDGDEPYPEPKEWTRENILEQLKSDVEFGFEKALDQRGISASLMFYVVLRWNQVLEEGLENYPEENYAMYGLPLFKATAVKYGWENPIGDDKWGRRVLQMSSAMKGIFILKAISDAIEEYEENQQRRIDLLESKILLFEREREAFIRHLREGNIQLLKDYLGIKDE